MEITIDKLLDIIKKNIIFILIVGILFGALAFIVTDFFITPTYKAYVRFYVKTPENINQTIDNQRKITQTYITFLDTDEFCSQLLDSAGIALSSPYSATKLKSMIRYAIVNNTEVFDLTITGKNAADLFELAQAAASIAPRRINSFDSDSNVGIVQHPLEDKIHMPVSPNVRNNTIIGVLLGLAFAFGLVFLRDMLDVRIKNADDLTMRYKYPIIGSVPLFHGETKSGK